MTVPTAAKDDLLGGPGPVQLIMLQHLAKGSFGSVSQCEMRRSDGDWIPVAVKTAVPSEQSEKFHRALDRECKFLQTLKHENIVELLAVLDGDSPGELVMVLEHLSGLTLASLLAEQLACANSPLYTKKQAAKWLREVACALHYMHTAGENKKAYLHRDVSSNNVMLTSRHLRSSKAKLIDFGLAQALLDVHKEPDSCPTSLPVNMESAENNASDITALQVQGGLEVVQDIPEDASSPTSPPVNMESAQNNADDTTALQVQGGLEVVQDIPEDAVPSEADELSCATSEIGPMGTPEAQAEDQWEEYNQGSEFNVRARSSPVSLRRRRTVHFHFPDYRKEKQEENEGERVRSWLDEVTAVSPSRLTKSCGTFLSMAPEVSRQFCTYTTKVDIFALGVLIFQLFHYAPMADIVRRGYGLSVVDAHQRIERGWRPHISQKCPPAIADLIERCWHQDPDQRPTALQVIQELSTYIDSLPMSVKKRASGILRRSRDSFSHGESDVLDSGSQLPRSLSLPHKAKQSVAASAAASESGGSLVSGGTSNESKAWNSPSSSVVSRRLPSKIRNFSAGVLSLATIQSPRNSRSTSSRAQCGSPSSSYREPNTEALAEKSAASSESWGSPVSGGTSNESKARNSPSSSVVRRLPSKIRNFSASVLSLATNQAASQSRSTSSRGQSGSSSSSYREPNTEALPEKKVPQVTVSARRPPRKSRSFTWASLGLNSNRSETSTDSMEEQSRSLQRLRLGFSQPHIKE